MRGGGREDIHPTKTHKEDNRIITEFKVGHFRCPATYSTNFYNVLLLTQLTFIMYREILNLLKLILLVDMQEQHPKKFSL